MCADRFGFFFFSLTYLQLIEINLNGLLYPYFAHFDKNYKT
jgi:hypothetical protein